MYGCTVLYDFLVVRHNQFDKHGGTGGIRGPDRKYQMSELESKLDLQFITKANQREGR